MSAQIDDGGPAFPNNDAHGCAYAGMTLRDWFAGQALAGLLANGGAVSWEGDATNAYTVADAMIEARKGGER
jgi:hypothetical protein